MRYKERGEKRGGDIETKAEKDKWREVGEGESDTKRHNEIHREKTQE